MARRNRLADMLEEDESLDVQEEAYDIDEDEDEPGYDDFEDEEWEDEEREDEGNDRAEEPDDDEPDIDDDQDEEDEEDWSASYFRRNKAPEPKPNKLKLFVEKKKEERAKAKAERIEKNYRFRKKEQDETAERAEPVRPAKSSLNPEIPEDDFVDLEEDDSLDTVLLEQKKNKRQKYIQLAFQIVLSVACVYVLFLIYGVIMTDFAYNEQGKVEPQVMTVKDVQEKKQFEIIMGQYENCRELYEKVLMLDYRISQGIEDPLVIAPEYNALLDDKKSTTDVSDLTGKIKGMDIPAKYSSLQNMMLTWVASDVSEYLQLMNDGLAMNDSGILTEALARRAVVLNDFSIITENIISLGSSINGVDLTETKKWNPDSYIEQAINGD